MEALPNDILKEIIVLLPLWQINDQLWQRLYNRDHDPLASVTWRGKTWYERYIEVGEKDYFKIRKFWIDDETDYGPHRKFCAKLFERLELIFENSRFKNNPCEIYSIDVKKHYSDMKISVIANSRHLAEILLGLVYYINDNEPQEFFKDIYWSDLGKPPVSLTKIMTTVIEKKLVNISEMNVLNLEEAFNTGLNIEIWGFDTIKSALTGFLD